MTTTGSVERVIIVPRNGLANRLQAWASAAGLAGDIGAPLSCVWETEQVLPAKAEDLFSSPSSFMSVDELTSLLGIAHADLPRYLTRRKDVLILAGHDRGEQVFMDELAHMVAGPSSPRFVVIIAGGHFHLPDSTRSIERRGQFYRSLTWSDAVTERARSASRNADPYVALHVRQTDRSLEAPTARAIRRGLDLLRRQRSEASLFIAADTAEGQGRWSRQSASLGFMPWSSPAPVRDRTQVESTLDAAADWLLLAGSSAIVHPAASTFSAEAAVASGHPETSIPLVANPALQATRKGAAWMRSALTYPSRRFG